MRLIAIVAADAAWGIGKDGGMLYQLPLDLKYFAQQTRGHAVVMGRATLQSLPGGQPLKGRTNIVLTRDRSLQVPGAQVVHSLAELARALAPLAGQDVFVIGGQQVYEQLCDHCHMALVTRVQATRPADTFFPDLDARSGWRLAERSAPVEEGGVVYTHCTYVNDRPAPLG